MPVHAFNTPMSTHRPSGKVYVFHKAAYGIPVSVEGHIHARPEAVGRSSHLGYVGHRTGCGGTGAMSWSADIHCVGAMGYGGESRGFVARRSEEFEFYCHIFGKISQNTP